MLLDHLDSHPLLFGFPLETKILPDYLSGRRWRGDFSDNTKYFALWEHMTRSFPFVTANQGQPVQIPATWTDFPRAPAAVFNFIMKYFAAREGKVRWCEKSPMHVQYMTTLASAFPDAQFVHLIRDGRDCAASFHRRWGYTPRSSIYRWKRCVQDGRLQGASLGPSRYLEVSYENLTRDPLQQLTNICAFLDIKFDVNMLRARRDASRVRGLSDRQITTTDARYRTYFNSDDLLALENIAGATLAALGYQTDCPTSDRDPHFLQRQAWRVIDRSRFAASLLRARAAGPAPFPWRRMYSKFARALRQFRSERF